MAQRKRHSGRVQTRRRSRVSDGGADWGEIILGAAAGVGGVYLLESIGVLGVGSSTKTVGTEVDVLPSNPLAYLAAIPLSVVIWALFIP